jgi:hypothetical protein
MSTVASTTQPPKTAIDYLTVVAGTVIVFAALMLATRLITDGLFSWMFFGETGEPAGFPQDAIDYYRVIYGILGAVMIGWFALVIWVVRGPLASGVAGAWTALVVSIGGWFVIDTTFSLASGFWENAVLNVCFLGAFLPGLWLSRGARAAAQRP